MWGCRVLKGEGEVCKQEAGSSVGKLQVSVDGGDDEGFGMKALNEMS